MKKNLTADDLKRMELTDDRVLVLEDLPEDTPSGIQLLSNDHKFDRFGTVIMCGPGVHPVGMPIKPKDRVIISMSAGIPLLVDMPDEEHGGTKEVEFQIVRLTGILGVIEEDEQPSPQE